LAVRETLDQRLQIAWVDRPAEKQVMVDLLEPRAIDQPRDVGEHRQRHERQEQQPPWRSAGGAVKQEWRVGGPPRDRPVHVVYREIGHALPARIASTNV